MILALLLQHNCSHSHHTQSKGRKGDHKFKDKTRKMDAIVTKTRHHFHGESPICVLKYVLLQDFSCPNHSYSERSKEAFHALAYP